MAHHLVHYPPDDFISDEYRHAGKNSATFTFIAAFFPFLCLTVMLPFFGIISIHTAVLIFFSMVSVGTISDVVHEAIHLRESRWHRWIPAFETLRRRHLLHHKNMKKNFGIWGHTCDRLAGTFKDT